MKKLILGFFLVFSFMNIFGQSNEILLEKAEQLYIQGEYKQAIATYEEILASGEVAPELYYNLGNAYFRNKQHGEAILNYQRALRLDPDDEDILHNLEVANSQNVDIIEAVPMIFYERWWRNFLQLQSVDGWAKTSIAGIILFLGFLLSYFFSKNRTFRKISFFVALFFLLGGLISLWSANLQYQNLYIAEEGIVLADQLTARSSPDESGPSLFVLHEGSKVEVLKELGEYYEIRLSNGNVGWIKKEGLRII